MQMKRAQFLLIVTVTFLFCFHANALESDDKNVRIQTVKAAIVYQLLKYIQPKDQNVAWRQAHICISKNPLLYSKLSESLANKTTSHYTIQRAEEVRPEDCDIIYLETANASLPQEIAKYKKHGALIIGSSEDIVEHQGMVSLIEENGKIKIDVNLAATEAAGYKVDPDLLSVVRRVLR